MRAYLDAGFLLTSLIHTTKGSQIANQLLREWGAPFHLNFLHQLQVENLLVTLQTSAETERQRIGSEGHRLWRNYFSEGVLQLTPADWDSAFRMALTWNGHSSAPAPFLLLLHPALALSNGATHFMSFDPRSREVARATGLGVLPEGL
ncbi:MAG: hypothetical protein AB9869_14335 [Verrucomicrobiia bacterium]